MGIIQNLPRVNISQFAKEGMCKMQAFEVFCSKVVKWYLRCFLCLNIKVFGNRFESVSILSSIFSLHRIVPVIMTSFCTGGWLFFFFFY